MTLDRASVARRVYPGVKNCAGGMWRARPGLWLGSSVVGWREVGPVHIYLFYATWLSDFETTPVKNKNHIYKYHSNKYIRGHCDIDVP